MRDCEIKITIDGPAGAGKTTAANLLAEQIDYDYISTGAMYRAFALGVVESSIPLEGYALKAYLESADIQSINDVTLLDGREVSNKLNSPEVTRMVSQVCHFPEIRAIMVAKQRALGAANGIVMEGRDIGTVVLPDAELKIYLTASIEERARRRLNDLENDGHSADIEQLVKEIEARDHKDRTRAVGPLLKADHAIEIDNSDMDVEDELNLMIKLFNKYKEEVMEE